MKRLLVVEEKEFYIIQRAVEDMGSSCIEPAMINQNDLHALDSRLTRLKFKELPKAIIKVPYI